MKVTISRHTLNTEQIVIECDAEDIAAAQKIVDARALEMNVRTLVAEFKARKAKLAPEVEQVLWSVVRTLHGQESADPSFLPADTRASIERAKQENDHGAAVVNGAHGG